MAIQITILGLGEIGASFGLALAGQNEQLRRVGHDKQVELARRAEKMGAVDKVEINLPAAVRPADIVILALPIDQMHETLQLIAPDLKEGAVVMDTGPLKGVLATWAADLLPPNRYYIGLTPVINPAYLHSTDLGIDAAHADLFRGGVIAIVAPPRASSEAIKLAADLTHLLGANPLFADPLEMDGLLAATLVAPQLLAAALLNITVGQPGWRENQKIAGRPYAEATAPIVHMTNTQALRTAILLNRENVLRVLDSVVANLQTLREDIAAENTQALDECLDQARQGRVKWWQDRFSGDWMSQEAISTIPTPSASDIFGRWIGFGRKPKK